MLKSKLLGKIGYPVTKNLINIMNHGNRQFYYHHSRNIEVLNDTRNITENLLEMQWYKYISANRRKQYKNLPELEEKDMKATQILTIVHCPRGNIIRLNVQLQELP